MAPSLLAADFARLGEQAEAVEAAGAGILVAGTAVSGTDDLRATMDGMQGAA